MSIHYIQGDATHPVGDGPKIIAHICNDVGKWASGFVLALSRRWPEPEAAYRSWMRQSKTAECQVRQSIVPVANFVVETEDATRLGSVQFVDVDDDLVVANMISQHGIRRRQGPDGSDIGPAPIRYGPLERALLTVANQAVLYEPAATVHMPRIGCDRAGGSWDRVEPIIRNTLAVSQIDVWVYDMT